MGDSIASQTAQAAGMSAMSNVLAQCISAYQTQSHLSFRFGPLARYVLYGVLNTPLNCIWQEYLEAKFPADDAANREKRETQTNSNGTKNLISKFALDQSIGAAGNILFFIFVQGLLKGASLASIKTAILQDSLDIYVSGLMIWPLVSLISFAWLPVERRVLFGCAAGIVWGIYLSLVAK